MALTDTQTRSLKAKLKCRHVRIRELCGSPVAYVEGWHAISEANRIFGFDSWDRQTLSPRCHWSHLQQGETICFYSTKVRITVRAGDTTTVREGIGTGFGRAQHPELAHDVALKAAETDATKRALATFGNPFGLALYDREQTQVTKARKKATAITDNEVAAQELVLRDGEGRELQYADAAEFVAEALRQIAELDTVESVYAFWSRNSAAFGKLKLRSGDGAASARRLADALKARAREIGVPQQSSGEIEEKPQVATETPGSYFIPKEKRIRDRDHLAFVASQPCLICGRRPAQAHHVRFAQPHGLGMKVSDEFTVPLCNTHHDQLHRSGDEKKFWAQNGVPDPLKFAARLWEASRNQRAVCTGNRNGGSDSELQER